MYTANRISPKMLRLYRKVKIDMKDKSSGEIDRWGCCCSCLLRSDATFMAFRKIDFETEELGREAEADKA